MNTYIDNEYRINDNIGYDCNDNFKKILVIK